jgi:hypothetical protein
MSKLHKPAIERVEADIAPKGHRAVFEALIAEAEEFGNEVGQVCMPYIAEGDEYEEGTWIPELWFVVRKVLPGD